MALNVYLKHLTSNRIHNDNKIELNSYDSLLGVLQQKGFHQEDGIMSLLIMKEIRHILQVTFLMIAIDHFFPCIHNMIKVIFIFTIVNKLMSIQHLLMKKLHHFQDLISQMLSASILLVFHLTRFRVFFQLDT